MAILKVARLGHPVLRQAAKPVPPGDIGSSAIQRLIDDMIETMHEYDGVGIAAPQVHQSLRLAVIEVAHNPRYPQAPETPLTVLINPEITACSDAQPGAGARLGWEGCLSVDGLRGQVPRAERLSARWLDRAGRPVQAEAQGFFAVVIQHEVDHLNGKVFLDRMADLTTLTHLKEYERYWLHGDEPESE
ncbi:MAG TPA: peptide deformylase [Nitrospiria bacterium]|nr:peptide deformylase [Nitrospiria bacterium]